jgi:lipopolysaccharide export system permease protein
VLTAAHGRLWANPEDDARYLSLIDGYQVRHRSGLADGELREIRFARNDIRLPVPTLVAGSEGELIQTLPALWPPETAAAVARMALAPGRTHWRP